MKNKFLINLFSLLLVSNICFSQQTYTLSGFIKDAESGETLIGATISAKNQLTKGVISNVYGFYSLTLKEGSYEIIYSYLGFETVIKKVEINQNEVLNIEMPPQLTSLDEVKILSEGYDKNVRKAEMGIVKLSPKEINSIPVIFGEQDVLKTLHLLPGVRGGSEGTSGFHVRGGGADQNLTILDEAPVYNTGHLLGFFSVFNSDAINDFILYKGNAPAQFGGRLSSVLDVRMKDGNSKKTQVSGGIGLIASRLTLEGPLKKDKSSFIISGRRTYADALAKLSGIKTIKETTLYFYDLNAKANYQLNDKNRLYLSGYFGKDICLLQSFNNSGTRMNFGNATGTARWNHIFNNQKLFLNSTLIFSEYKYSVGITSKNVNSTIKDINLKQDFTYYLNPSNSINFGLNAIHHTFKPALITTEGVSNENTNKEDKFALEGGAYLSHNTKLGRSVNVEYGLRWSAFSFIGPGRIYMYDLDGNIMDSTDYKKNEIIKNYNGLEPRITASFMLNEVSSVKASYSRNRQYIHLVSNSSSTSNFEVWQPSTNNVRPEIADQYALGYFRNFSNNNYESSIEVYYKDLQNQIEYRDGANVLFSSDIEADYVYGNGMAYGLELYVKKSSGKLTGWVSYTIGRTERKFAQINKGKKFPARHDRMHDISIVGVYKLSPRISLSASWVYYTGNAVTYPSGKYVIEGITAPLFTERNAYRMPNYHRLDLGMTLEGKNKKHRIENYHSSWSFSLYNAYARQNAYFIEFEHDPNNEKPTKAIQNSLFSITPSVSYNFNF